MIDTLEKLDTYHHGFQQQMLNQLAGPLQLQSLCRRAAGVGVADAMAEQVARIVRRSVEESCIVSCDLKTELVCKSYGIENRGGFIRVTLQIGKLDFTTGLTGK
jgi:hypothetical protein